MELLGDRSWYMPKFLGWLPDFRVEAEPAAGHHRPTVGGD
jgi:hypothetical protein